MGTKTEANNNQSSANLNVVDHQFSTYCLLIVQSARLNVGHGDAQAKANPTSSSSPPTPMASLCVRVCEFRQLVFLSLLLTPT